MSNMAESPESGTPNNSSMLPQSSTTAKSERALACVLCNRRKVKCNRKFPCANCLKARVQCIPSTAVPRRRKYWQADKELHEQLRHYEELLRRNNIKFEPLHVHSTRRRGSSVIDDESDAEVDLPGGLGADELRAGAISMSMNAYNARNILNTISQGLQDRNNASKEDENKIGVKEVWEQLFKNNDFLLFGLPGMSIDITPLHPDPFQILQIWQHFLDNINPLFKVIHTSSMQVCIIEAASSLKDISPTQEALMFSIYSISIMSMSIEACRSKFRAERDDLLKRYQLGCQQALVNCGFLRSDDRNCLTALFLYLVSVRPSVVPQSLASMLGIAIRAAQRMGINDEEALSNCTIFEAEMRRRLWWALVLFDDRICQLAENRGSALLSLRWDCRVPLNVNDSELHPEMKQSPVVTERHTESIFPMMRSEIGDFIRHSVSYRNPSIVSARAESLQPKRDLDELERNLNHKYLEFCDLDNSLHFMTTWISRSLLATYRLMEYYSTSPSFPEPRTKTQLDNAMHNALSMLECDTKIISSTLIQGFRWLAHLYFPFLAYIHIANDLRSRPHNEQVVRAWEVMSDNFEARFLVVFPDESPFLRMFGHRILQAWAVCESTIEKSGKSLQTPKMVSSIRLKMTEMVDSTEQSESRNPDYTVDAGTDNYLVSMPVDIDGQYLLQCMWNEGINNAVPTEQYPNGPRQVSLDYGYDAAKSTTVNDNPMDIRGPTSAYFQS